MGDIGVPELVIILVIVVVLFGASRLKGLGSALGGGIREFKQAVRDETEATAPTLDTATVATAPTLDTAIREADIE